MMRQYELVERVQRYKPDVNEALLNKAYVYAMQKHGHQKRASGDPYFSHPLEVAAILTDMHLDEATIAVALLHDTIEDTDGHPRRDRRALRRRHRQAGRGPDQAQEARPRLQEGRAGGEPAQAAAGHLRGRARPAGQARRPPAQHAHARPRAARTSALRIAEETMDIYAPLAGRMGMQDMREELEELAFRHINPEAYRDRHRAARRDLRAQASGVDRRDREGAVRRCSRRRHQGRRSRAGRRSPGRCSARWRPRRCPSSSCPTSSASASSSTTIEDCYRALGVIHTHLVDGARPLQGLHLDAQAERLPLDPHHHRRPVAPARRAADPHRAR